MADSKRKSNLYTKIGDHGTTRLVDGSTVPKANPRVAAYGTLDELNSQLGEVTLRLSRSAELAELRVPMKAIQNTLFNIGSRLACSDVSVLPKLPEVTPLHVSALEEWIDHFDGELPPLKNFILPGGTEAACALHVARTICRRGERQAIGATIGAPENTYQSDLIYLNRLSDFLFAAARWCNHKLKHPDVLWEK